MDQNKSLNECVIIVKKMNADMVDAYLPVIMFLIISMVIGAIGNFFVTYIYYLKFHRNATKLFIVTLSLCDLLTCIICIPMELAVLYYSYIFDSDVACRVIRFCVCLATVTSGMIVFIIALDRYLLISRPRAKKITVVKAKKILKYLILFSLISSTPTLVLYGIHFRMVGQCENIGTDCTISSQVADTPYPLIYHLILGALCYSLYTFILVIYLMIGKSVWRAVALRSLKKINFIDSSITTDTSTQNPNQSQSRSRSRSQSEDKCTEVSPVQHSVSFMNVEKSSINPTRASLISMSITFVWLITYIPHFVIAFIKMTTTIFVNNPSIKHRVIYRALVYSFYLSSAINPLIYGLFSRKFRNELSLLLGKVFSRGTK